MGTQYGPENTGPVRRYGAGGGVGPGILSLPGAETLNVLWVDKGLNPAGTADGSVQLPYHAIDVAVNAALALVPTASNPVAIIVMPGVYAEQVTLDTDYVYLFGWSRETTILAHTLTPLTITSELTAVRGMTLQSTLAGARAIVINTGVPGTPVWIEECTIVVPALANTSVYTQNDSEVTFKDCDFVGASVDVDIYFQDDVDARLEMWECRVTGSFDLNAGSILLKGCEVHGQVDLNVAGDVQIFDCLLSYPTGAPLLGGVVGAELRDNVFETNAASYDFDDNGQNLDNCIVENNVFTGLGLGPNVGTMNPVKYIGVSGQTDYYSTIQDCLVAIGNDPVIIELLTDVTLTGAFTKGVNGPVTFEGNGHTISRAAGAVFLITAGTWWRFRNIHLVGEIQTSGGNQLLELLEGTTMVGRINISGGDATTTVRLDGAEVIGDAFTGNAFRMRDIDPFVEIIRSRVKGAAGSAAIHYQTGTNNNISIKYSTVWHGDGAANNPFTRSGVQTPTIRSHHSRFNTSPYAAGWLTNLIAVAQRFESFDVQTDY